MSRVNLGDGFGWFDDEKGSLGAANLKREHRSETNSLRGLIRNSIDGSNDKKIAQSRDALADIERRILEFARS